CVNYTEHFTIDASGGGSIRAFLMFKGKKAMASGEKLGTALESFIGEAPGLELSDYSSEVSGNVRATEFTIEFDHVSRLKSIGEGDGAGEVVKFFGAFEVEKQSDRFAVSRTVDLSGGFGSFKPEEQGNFGKKLTGAVLSNYHFTYHMHFPTKVLESNGVVKEESPTSTSWSAPLSQIINGPMEMRVDIYRPPVKTWIALGVLGLGVPVAGFWFWRKRQGDSET
ncbi:MAG: hypothetical protein AAGH89_17200, partial [Verrucomicrobiota bacterium]